MRNLMLSVGVIVVSIAASCAAPPRPWLRFEPAGKTNWRLGEGGLLSGRLHGADLSLDLAKKDTRVLVKVENRSPAPVEMRMGPEGAAPRVAIGEVLLRPLATQPAAVGPDMLPYTTMQIVKVDPECRGEFYLDAPLGREPRLGQYFVLTVEARDASGRWDRLSLPLEAVNSGTKPADGR